MKAQLTTRCLFRVILCILALGCRALAGGIFFDDFSDGEIQDDTPVTWYWGADRGQCVPTPDGLQLKPTRPGATILTSWLVAYAQHDGTNVQYTGNVSIRAQLNIGSGQDARGAVGLRAAGTNAGYMFVIIRDSFFFCHLDGYFLPSWQLPRDGSYDSQEDVIIQLDAIDITDDQGKRTSTRLEGRWWMPGEEMPVQPQIVVVDDKYAGGGFLVGAATNEPTSPNPTIFRWVEVVSTAASDPNPDINGDGLVNFKDYCVFANCWHSNEEPADMAPSIRDGVVDYKDLALLAEYWLADYRLIARWNLDETEGAIAHDSVGDKDGTVNGDPNWQSTGGKIDGALQFDGVADYISTEFALNPVEGSFSVFARIKGGAPGQAIISQTDLKVGRTTLVGSTWLGADSSDGKLITTLMEFPFGPLESEVVITDGQWHHVGLVYDLDASCRRLYADGVEVARDTNLVGGVASSGSLYIGAGKNLDAGSLFSGLIDDVRIYNVALSAKQIEELAR